MPVMIGQGHEVVLTEIRRNRYLTAPFLRDRSSIPYVTPFCGTISGEIFPTTLPLRFIAVWVCAAMFRTAIC